MDQVGHHHQHGTSHDGERDAFVSLGFVEKCEEDNNNLLLNEASYMPDKVGGKPVTCTNQTLPFPSLPFLLPPFHESLCSPNQINIINFLKSAFLRFWFSWKHKLLTKCVWVCVHTTHDTHTHTHIHTHTGLACPRRSSFFGGLDVQQVWSAHATSHAGQGLLLYCAQILSFFSLFNPFVLCHNNNNRSMHPWKILSTATTVCCMCFVARTVLAMLHWRMEGRESRLAQKMHICKVADLSLLFSLSLSHTHCTTQTASVFSFRVFRCQLPMDNEYYKEKPEEQREDGSLDYDYSHPEGGWFPPHVREQGRGQEREREREQKSDTCIVSLWRELSVSACLRVCKREREKDVWLAISLVAWQLQKREIYALNGIYNEERLQWKWSGVWQFCLLTNIILFLFNIVNYCAVCGAGATKRCGACRQMYYCSQLHQKEHWAREHRDKCAKNGQQTGNHTTVSPLLFEEFEIITEEEGPEEEGQGNPLPPSWLG